MPHSWDCGASLETVRRLGVVQLRELLEDEETLLRAVRSSRQVQDLQKQSEVKWASNRRLAEQNLSYQPYIKNSKTLLVEKYQLLGQAMSSLRRKHRKLDALHGKLRLKATRQFLKQKVAHFMNESESLWQKFLEGNMLPVDFLESFRSTRKFYYRHLVQVEKMQDLSTHEQRRTETLPKYFHSANTVNVFYSLPPVMLPSTILPVMGRSYLPPLNHHGGGAIWTPFIPLTNPGQSQEDMRVWSQRLEHLQQQKETKDLGPKSSP
ncbi:hypothetical protein SRHO_G00201950 [Serrasalmus rhombeus]